MTDAKVSVAQKLSGLWDRHGGKIVIGSGAGILLACGGGVVHPIKEPPGPGPGKWNQQQQKKKDDGLHPPVAPDAPAARHGGAARWAGSADPHLDKPEYATPESELPMRLLTASAPMHRTTSRPRRSITVGARAATGPTPVRDLTVSR